MSFSSKILAYKCPLKEGESYKCPLVHKNISHKCLLKKYFFKLTAQYIVFYYFQTSHKCPSKHLFASFLPFLFSFYPKFVRFFGKIMPFLPTFVRFFGKMDPKNVR